MMLYSDHVAASGRRDILAVTQDEVQKLAIASEIGSQDVIHASIRPNVVLESTDSLVSGSKHLKSLSDYSSIESTTLSIDPIENCTRCAVVNIIAQSMGTYPKGEPLRSIARMSREYGRRGLVLGSLASLRNKTDGSSPKTIAVSPRSLLVGQEVVAKR